MSAKGLIWIGVFVGTSVGGWVGATLDHGNWLGGWSIGLGAIGAFAGIWAGYKISQLYTR